MKKWALALVAAGTLSLAQHANALGGSVANSFAVTQNAPHPGGSREPALALSFSNLNGYIAGAPANTTLTYELFEQLGNAPITYSEAQVSILFGTTTSNAAGVAPIAVQLTGPVLNYTKISPNYLCLAVIGTTKALTPAIAVN
jgi:hypothetical protein